MALYLRYNNNDYTISHYIPVDNSNNYLAEFNTSLRKNISGIVYNAGCLAKPGEKND